MTSKQDKPDHEPTGKNKSPAKQAPEWAGGLRQLYDSVVEEPLPDSFKDLLAQLDDSPSGDTSK